MKTIQKKTGRGTFLTWALTLTAFCLNAQTPEQLKAREAAHDSYIGFYIVGGILGFGIVAFIIFSIVDKYKKDDEKPNNFKHLNHHRHHHHHRVIKKSA